MRCVIFAGGRPSQEDPLYEFTRGDPKALLNIAGRPMISWIIAALESSRSVDSIAIVGLNANLSLGNEIEFIADQGSLLDNVLAGIQWAKERDPQGETLMLSSSDIPAVTGPIIDSVVESCAPFQKAIYYPVVSQRSMESRFPGANRTYVKLKDIFVAGGDLIIINPNLVEIDQEFWHAIFEARKYPWRIAKLVGVRTLFKFITRQLTLNEATEIGQKIVGQPVEVLVADHAEIAMDVDKPDHLELLASELTNSNRLIDS
jgi:GTP:adenosylcobinamide-phosphate guanylyltransferase